MEHVTLSIIDKKGEVMNDSQNHCKEMLIGNATENVTPEAIDLIVKRCQQQHDKAIFIVFTDIFNVS